MLWNAKVSLVEQAHGYQKERPVTTTLCVEGDTEALARVAATRIACGNYVCVPDSVVVVSIKKK
jgi:hypothetical protein